MLALQIFLILSAAVAGSTFYRMRGGPPSWPRPIEQMLFCLGLLMTLWAFNVTWPLTAAGYVIAVVVLLMGHGQFFLDLMVKAIESERVDFILRAIFGDDPRTNEKYAEWRGDNWEKAPPEIREQISADMVAYGMDRLYWRNVAGMALTGVLVTLVPGIILAFFNPLAGFLIAISGAVKGPVYMLAHRAGWGTAGGEHGFGGACWFLWSLISVLFVWMC